MILCIYEPFTLGSVSKVLSGAKTLNLTIMWVPYGDHGTERVNMGYSTIYPAIGFGGLPFRMCGQLDKPWMDDSFYL